MLDWYEQQWYIGEPNTLHRSNKKLKHAMDDGKNSVQMETEVEQIQSQQSDEPVQDVHSSWAANFFKEAMLKIEEYTHYGEDEEEQYPRVDALFNTSADDDTQPPKYGPRVEISKDKYLTLFKQWWVLDQKVRELWQLEAGHELTNLTKGYYIVRFFSRNDYLHVLEGDPWIILGHYLTVSKWRLTFFPSIETITTTLVWVHFSTILLELLDE